MRGGHRRQPEAPRPNNDEEREVCSDIRQHGNGVRCETERRGKIATNANASRVHKLDISTEPTEPKPRCGVPYERGDFCGFPTQSPICSGDDGLPIELDGIAFSKWRKESVKAYGNAIVPQVAHQIFKAIQQYEKL
jgi:DNA (cytosine-5)-methyltransferase 1